MRAKSENQPSRLQLGRVFILLLLVGSWGGGCGVVLDDDDTSPVDDDDVGDDDDSTPPVPPLAPVIGVFNLTNVVQANNQSYVDFSGAFGSIAEHATETFSVAAYLATFAYGADAPYWRVDLGAFPLPAENEAVFTDMLAYYPWVPQQQQWWDGGRAIGAGNYLTSRLDLDDLSAYQVDDPIFPGAAGWTTGGTLRWENGGADPVVAWSLDDAIRLPSAMEMTTPLPSSVVGVAAALPFTVEWTPKNDDSFVTVGLLDDRDYAWITRVPDNGSFTIPQSVLSDDFGAGDLELVLGRTVEQSLPHPQGDILLRSREEQRATLRLLPDLMLDPGFGEPGETLTLSLAWFTQDLSAGVTVDFGAGIGVVAVQPQTNDIHRADVTIEIAGGLPPGSRDVTVTTTSGASETLSGGFAILSLSPSDNCDDAGLIPPLEDGSWVSTTAGLANDYGSGIPCVPWSLNGSDAVYRVPLEMGETLVANLSQGQDSDPALLLLSSCGDIASAVACADNGYLGDPELLVYTAASAGDYYIVVDSWVGGNYTEPSSAFQLDIATERDVIDPDWIVPGGTKPFTLFSESPWPPGILPADINLGAGIGIQATAAGATPTELDLLATANPTAAVGARDISIDLGASGSINIDDGLWVTGWPPYNSCSSAIAAPSLGVASAVGYGVQTNSSIDDVPCMPYASTGPDVLLPFDLVAGELLSATVLSDQDTQLYILSDCGDPSACFDDAAQDSGVGFDPETIVDWLVPATGRYYLVIDIWGAATDPLTPWLFDLQVSLQ